MTSAKTCSVSKRLASASFRRLLLGKLLTMAHSSGNVRLSHLLSWVCSTLLSLRVADTRSEPGQLQSDADRRFDRWVY